MIFRKKQASKRRFCQMLVEWQAAWVGQRQLWAHVSCGNAKMGRDANGFEAQLGNENKQKTPSMGGENCGFLQVFQHRAIGLDRRRSPQGGNTRVFAPPAIRRNNKTIQKCCIFKTPGQRRTMKQCSKFLPLIVSVLLLHFRILPRFLCTSPSSWFSLRQRSCTSCLFSRWNGLYLGYQENKVGERWKSAGYINMRKNSWANI